MANDLSPPIAKSAHSSPPAAPQSLRNEIRLLAVLVAVSGALVLILGLGAITFEGFHFFSEHLHLPANALAFETEPRGFADMMVITAGGCFTALGTFLMIFALLMPRVYR